MTTTLAELKEKIKNDKEWLDFLYNMGLHVQPTFKRMLIKESSWTTKIRSVDGAILTLDYNPARPEKERGDRPSIELARYTIIAVADDCDPIFAPGMDIAIIPQENMGFSTKIRFCNREGKGLETYSIIQEHEALFIIIDDRIKALDMFHREEINKLTEEKPTEQSEEDLYADLAKQRPDSRTDIN